MERRPPISTRTDTLCPCATLCRSYLQAHRMLKRWLPHQLGHFYSPVGDIDALALERGRLWPRDAICPGIDFEPAAQSLLLREVFPAQLSGFDYPARADNEIGRASGRERVVSVRLNLGGRRIIKKKK